MPTTWTKFKAWLEGETELVVTFPTYAVADEDADELRFQLGAWVYEPEAKSWTKNTFIDQLRDRFALEPDTPEALLFSRRVRPFLVDNERNQHVKVQVGDELFDLGRSAADGHVHGELVVPLSLAREAFVHSETGPRLPIRAFVDTDEDAREVPVLTSEGTSVVSDIDDTVKITSVLDHHEMLRNTFLRPFTPVEALAAMYRKWAEDGVAFHYVSASPWQLLPFFEEFMEEHGFPIGSFHLRKLRIKSVRSPIAFVKSSQEHKIGAIQGLYESLGQRKFVLVGDSGERDPEVYGEIARRFPGRTAEILIRKVPDADNSEERFAAAFADFDNWDVRDLV